MRAPFGLFRPGAAVLDPAQGVEYHEPPALSPMAFGCWPGRLSNLAPTWFDANS